MYARSANLIELFRLGMDRSVDNLLTPPGPALNLGCGNKIMYDCTNLDLPEWNWYTQGLDEYKNDSIAAIYMFHFLEHIHNPIELLQECQRVLGVGGVCNIVVPYATSELALQDLTHKNFFVETTWKTLMENPYYNPTEFEWRLRININMIIGLNARNLSLVTQLVKV